MSKCTRIESASRAALLALWAATSTCSAVAHAQNQDARGSQGEGAAQAQVQQWRLDGVVGRLDAARGGFWLQPEVTVLQGEASLDGSDRAYRVVVDADSQVWTPDGRTRPFGFNALDQAVRARREISVIGVKEKGATGEVLRARLIILPDLLPANWRPRPLQAAHPSPRATPRLAPDARTAARTEEAQAQQQQAQQQAQQQQAQQQQAQQQQAQQQQAQQQQAQRAQDKARARRAEQERRAQAEARRAQQQQAARRVAAIEAAQSQAARAAQEQHKQAQARQAAQKRLAQTQQEAQKAQEQKESVQRRAQLAQQRAEATQRHAELAQQRAEATQRHAELAQQRKESAREHAESARGQKELAQERVEQARERQERARWAQEQQARARIAARAREARRAARPTLSTAGASASAINSAAATGATPGRLAARALSPRDSKPPLGASSLPSPDSPRTPSTPRVALAPLARDGQLAAAASVQSHAQSQPLDFTSTPDLASPRPLQPRPEVAPLEAAPRDVEREKLRIAPPQASMQSAPAPWDSIPLASTPARAAGSTRASNADSTLAQPASGLAMRATNPVGAAQEERRVSRPPLLSTSRAGFGAAPSLGEPQVLTAPPAALPQVSGELAPQTPLTQAAAPSQALQAPDAVQMLARGEQAAAQARQNFALLRALQDQVPWPDFCAGVGSSTGGRAMVASAALADEPPKLVALTFDDGPNANTPRILDILEAGGARGTFFVVGRNVQKNPALVRETARRGHDIGSHSFHHVQGVRLSLAQWQQEIDSSNQTLASILGTAPRWFRAPGCHYSDEALQALRSRRMVRVDSSNNSGDWHENDPAKIVARVLSRLAPGQIILFHDPLPQTAAALPILLRELSARGYKCVTVSELARASAEDPAFAPPLCPPGQGIILPPSAFEAPRASARQAPQAPGTPQETLALPADAPVLLQAQP